MKPAITQLEEQLKALGTPNTLSEAKFTADSGFHSEENLKYVATTGLNSYMVDAQFRSRNPIFKISETYHTEKEKRRFKRSKGKPRLFTSKDFHYDKTQKVVAAQQGMKCGVAAITSKVQCALTHDFGLFKRL
ncbi:MULTISPECIES: hypothetical protein [unclassified Pseudoalteromonas]|uniref:hypothetical protein n=1 Tax=Pseudoalteromonas sp. '520P1 No. 423' TaxID=1690037 RepID=UPI00069435F5|nr:MULTISPECIES: hypothetical protein [unclassified Pseudoalteromonas]